MKQFIGINPLSKKRLSQMAIALLMLSTTITPVFSQPVPTKQINPTHSIKAKTALNQDALSLQSQLKNALPAHVKQGEVFWLDLLLTESTTPITHVSFLGKTFPVFKQSNNHYTAVIPVPVAHPVGSYMVSLKHGPKATLTSQAVKVISAGYSKQNIKVSRSVGGIQPQAGELATIGRLKRMTNPDKQWWDTHFVSPTPDCMNSRFGNLRYHNGKFTGNYHKGIDLKSPLGRPVKAPTSGTVTIAKTFRLHGGTVGLDHGQGLSSVYIHLSKILVKPGQHVKKGQVIGKVGSTGFATGPHLHWGVYANGQPVNPIQWAPQIKSCYR